MQREAYFDNAKLLFIFLVVFGHLIQPLQANLEIADALYQWIYLFHIPAFVLVSGFFAKGASDSNYLIKLTKRLILPYLFFQFFYTLIYFLSGKSGVENSLYEPHWSLWFLISLLCWHVLLIGFKKIKPAWGIVLAFALGLLIGYLSMIGHALSVSRTFVFFPFFLMGYWVNKEQIFKFQTKKLKITAFTLLVSVLVISYFYPYIPSKLMFGSYSYEGLGMPLFGALGRLGIYLVALVMVISALILVPRRRYSFTNFGQNTLYVYLLHGLIIQYIRHDNLLEVNQNLDAIGLAIIAAAIVWFLSSKWTITFAQPVIEWKTNLLQQWLVSRTKKRTLFYKEEV